LSQRVLEKQQPIGEHFPFVSLTSLSAQQLISSTAQRLSSSLAARLAGGQTARHAPQATRTRDFQHRVSDTL
jgi:hypothetical protein